MYLPDLIARRMNKIRKKLKCNFNMSIRDMYEYRTVGAARDAPRAE